MPGPAPAPGRARTCQCGSNTLSTLSHPAVARPAPAPPGGASPQPVTGLTLNAQLQRCTVDIGAPAAPASAEMMEPCCHVLLAWKPSCTAASNSA